jgi:hypothetical protein
MVLDGMRRELEQRSRVFGRTLANEWERELKRTNPVDTGNMRDHTTTRDTPGRDQVRVEAVVDTDYAEYVSGGTRPHVIAARNAKALRFTWQGRTVYFRSVNHPGTQANDWWTRSVRELPGLMQRVWRGVR